MDGGAIAVATEFSMGSEGICDEADIRTESMHLDSLSGGRLYGKFARGGRCGESGRELQGQPQEEQEEEERRARFATSKFLGH